MNFEKCFLKPNLVVEPLIDRWYAWPHLISPATAAMNIVGRHLKIMNSYIQSPDIHLAAVKNPKMLGGPFIDYDNPRVQEIQDLKNLILTRHSKTIKFAEALVSLDKLLKFSAKGFSLEPLYKDVPEILKGYVELVYDLNNQPSYRIFESLLYKSEFYRLHSQSVSLWITDNDERPFCLSTPRLDDAGVINLEIPFNHSAIDILCKMKRQSGNFYDTAVALGIKESQMPLFQSFFTEEVPPPYNDYKGENVRMRYFGHACILIETKGISILVDPLISYYGYESKVNHFTDMDLPDHIDFVLITHNHQDHILLETLLPIRHKIGKVIIPKTSSGALQDPSLKFFFQAIGFKSVDDLDELEQVNLNNCTITAIPFTGEHSDLNVMAKSCYHVSVEGFTFLFMADSRIIEPQLYKHIYEIIGNVDVVFLGMECDGAPLSWLYGPLLSENLSRDKDQSRRLSGSDFEKGKSLTDIFNPREVYVYAMGQEPWLEFISSIKYSSESNPIVQSDMLIEYCLNQNILAERLYGEKEILYQKAI